MLDKAASQADVPMTLERAASRQNRDRPTDEQVIRAAHELASQEYYNPGWCKPGVGNDGTNGELYRRRARLILEAANVR